MLKEEDLEQITNYLANEGFREIALVSTTGELENVNFTPELGEFLFLEDEEQLYFSKGEGLENAKIVPVLGQIELSESTEEIAESIWKNLDGLMTLGEKRDFIFKGELLASFIKLKPLKFSFLKGEEPLEGSLFDIFGDDTGLEPDIRGASPRNLSQGSLLDNEERQPGDYQEDAMQNHKHQYYYSDIQGHIPELLSLNGEHGNAVAHKGFWKKDRTWEDATTFGKETRSKNFAVLSVVKILP